MKTYKITASYTTQCTIEIQARDADHAYELAHELDGGDFETQIDGDDWQIDRITEVPAK